MKSNQGTQNAKSLISHVVVKEQYKFASKIHQEVGLLGIQLSPSIDFIIVRYCHEDQDRIRKSIVPVHQFIVR